MRIFDVATSFGASAMRLGNGMAVDRPGRRPDKTIELYEFEACPFCRKVREALTLLDLEVMVYPCPKGGRRFRPRVKQMGGKLQFPYLIDPNTGKQMYESDDIVAYLYGEYAAGPVPLALRLGALTNLSCSLATVMRPFNGLSRVPSRAPKQPLELWSFEASPFCRLVREALSSLELPYLLHNVGKGSRRRDAFAKRTGKMMVPYLADPNTAQEMFESADIVAYLHRTYGQG